MFRQNSAMQRGLPNCNPARTVASVEPPRQDPPVVNITNQIPAAPAAPSSSPGTVAVETTSSLARTAAPYVLTALGAGGLAAGASYFLRDNPAPPVPVVQPAGNDGSLLQYLQDQGKHLPEGAWPTNP